MAALRSNPHAYLPTIDVLLPPIYIRQSLDCMTRLSMASVFGSRGATAIRFSRHRFLFPGGYKRYQELSLLLGEIECHLSGSPLCRHDLISDSMDLIGSTPCVACIQNPVVAAPTTRLEKIPTEADTWLGALTAAYEISYGAAPVPLSSLG